MCNGEMSYMDEGASSLSRPREELQPWLTLLPDAWLSINEDKQSDADGIQMSSSDL